MYVILALSVILLSMIGKIIMGTLMLNINPITYPNIKLNIAAIAELRNKRKISNNFFAIYFIF